MDYLNFLKERLDKENFAKLTALENSKIIDFAGEYVELCNPASVFVRTDSIQDIEYIRLQALVSGEEIKLAEQGHTIHFDGYFDQARDKKNTRYLRPKSAGKGYYLNSVDKEDGLKEIKEILGNAMAGKEMFVCFFCLGPLNSDFSVLAVQITDSSYVAHSEEILYRPGYEQFKGSKDKNDFFKFIHTAGELEQSVSKNVDKRRVYIDLEDQLVYSTNTQYAGNSVGLKKLSLRLAIKKASQEGWLAEHMFLMGVQGKDNKKEYFCGAFPSMCGKTSTAMVSGESIIGDDIAYLREKNGKVYAVNVERGIFGIIKDVNREDDPVLFKSLANKGELIFSNILADENGKPFWIGKSGDLPKKGINFYGDWHPGKTDREGNEIPVSHKNARFTIKLKSLENVDENLENSQGVLVRGLIYGGRDSDTWVPVEQALNWQQGIIAKAASLESETTAATLGKEGVRVFNPMSNMDFLSVLIGDYIKMNLEFGKKLQNPPLIFSVNYFLRNKQGNFLNAIQDKRIWLKWIRLRVDSQTKGLQTPNGVIPCYQDLKDLFKEFLSKDYSEKDYIEQFTLRIPENLAKTERIKNIYKELQSIPSCLFEELDAQRIRLEECRKEFGDYVQPAKFKQEV
ncbi:MAG: phosphoenolpyruvate carboxykinase (GTP) [Candidatus Omnitrophota bacterium]